jgi:hypothetical protein
LKSSKNRMKPPDNAPATPAPPPPMLPMFSTARWLMRWGERSSGGV